MDKRNLAFGKVNFIMLAIGLAIVIIGFILLSGGSLTETAFYPSIFSGRHIKAAPVVSFFRIISIIGAIIYKPEDTNNKEG